MQRSRDSTNRTNTPDKRKSKRVTLNSKTSDATSSNAASRWDECTREVMKSASGRRDSIPTRSSTAQARRESSSCTISGMPSGKKDKVFTLTSTAKSIQSSNNMYELSGVYKPKVSALSQLIDLEEDMAKDGFDYSIFVAKEEPTDFGNYRNGLNDDVGTLEGFLKLKTEPVALWNERQAREKQQRCPKTSESGLMACWNVLLSLGVNPKVSMDDLVGLGFHREKDDTAPLPEFLASCSKHGMTHDDILKAMEVLSNGRIGGRFFEFYPQRRVDIRYWLAGWIKRGVVPLATLNYQKAVRCQTEEEKIHQPPDWHHHMVYGVSYDGVHLTNPLSKMKADHFKTRLESESVVMVHRDEILVRKQTGVVTEKDKELLKQSVEWRQMDVLGQIEVIEREEERLQKLSIQPGMKFIAIPSLMIGGICLFAHRDSENYKSILNSEEVFLKV